MDILIITWSIKIKHAVLNNAGIDSWQDISKIEDFKEENGE